jgi:DNA-binding IclR family transcriptional regulator
MGRSTAARVLHSLYVCEFLRRDEATGRYHLGAKFLELASEHRRTLSLNEVARRNMVALVQERRETVMLGVLDKHNAVIVDRVDGPQALRMTADIGVIQPAYSCALGKMMLSALPEPTLSGLLAQRPVSREDGQAVKSDAALIEDLQRVRARGWALDDNEQIEGVRCIAAPVLNQDRRVVASISLSGPSFRLPDDELENVAAAVIETANAISAQLGYVPERSDR